MIKGSTTVVDFIAEGDSPDEWRMVLVEEGPWSSSIETQLRRVQNRLYECIDAALGGQLAETIPESNGQKIVIQLDGYNLPKDEVAEFFGKVSKGVFSTAGYRAALEQREFVRGITFEKNFDSIH